MDWESFEATAVCDSAGSDSSEFVDDVTYDCDCPVYNAECSVVASAGYDWSESFDESANEVDDCPDNLISDVDFLALGSFNDRITVNCLESSDLGPQQSNEVALQCLPGAEERKSGCDGLVCLWEFVLLLLQD